MIRQPLLKPLTSMMRHDAVSLRHHFQRLVSPCEFRFDMMIRVLIADDHGGVAEGLRNLVEAQADMKVIALVADGREAVRRAIEDNPDVVLMDIAMPVLNG